jgi:hypothetical protein
LEIEPGSSKPVRWKLSSRVKKDKAVGGLIICSEELAAKLL